MHGGFEVWLLNGCGPNLCFPKAFEQSTKFPQQKSDEMSPYFRSKNQALLALSDTDCDNHTKRGKQIYIYIYIHTYIMHNVSTQSKKVNTYIPRVWLKIYKCRKINRGCHTLEIKTNGTWHDIPNTIQGRKGGGRKGFKRVHNPRERLNS